MPSELPRFTVRLPVDIHYKIKYIADDNFRPLNSEFLMLVLRRIEDYEREHGPIRLPEE
jgi:hypothetical protein